MKNHVERCKLHRAQRIKLPEADKKKGLNKIKFTKTENQLGLSFIIYAHFGSVLRQQDFLNHGHQNPSSPNTSITYYMGAVKYSDGKYFEPP